MIPKTGSPEWSTKRNKYYVENSQKQHNVPLKYKKPWINNFKFDGDKLKQNSETDLRKSNSAQAHTLAVRLRESELEHQQLHTAHERQLQLEAQTLRRSQDLEHQAANIAHEHEVQLRELREQSEAQPQLLKTQWKYQMSQQATYTAEIHELYTEIVNMREKSELQAALSAKMCRVEGPSLSVETEPENVLNTACPGRSPLDSTC